MHRAFRHHVDAGIHKRTGRSTPRDPTLRPPRISTRPSGRLSKDTGVTIRSARARNESARADAVQVSRRTAVLMAAHAAAVAAAEVGFVDYFDLPSCPPTATSTSLQPSTSPSFVPRTPNDPLFMYVAPPGPRCRRPTARLTAGPENAKCRREAVVLTATSATSCDAGVQISERGTTVSVAHLAPTPDPRYVTAPNYGHWEILRTIDITVATAAMVAAYDEIFRCLPSTFVAAGIYQRGLFTRDALKANSVVMEYTGIRVTASDVASFDRARDRYAMYLDTEVHVPSEGAIISPADVGNDARFVNHSCDPNCMLQEFDVVGRTVVGIVALCDITPSTELCIDYGYYSGLTDDPIRCYCGSSKCRSFI